MLRGFSENIRPKTDLFLHDGARQRLDSSFVPVSNEVPTGIAVYEEREGCGYRVQDINEHEGTQELHIRSLPRPRHSQVGAHLDRDGNTHFPGSVSCSHGA